MNIKYECSYCGHTGSIETYGWSSDFIYEIKCKVCKDPNVRQVEDKPTTYDVFGYNYKEKPYKRR